MRQTILAVPLLLLAAVTGCSSTHPGTSADAASASSGSTATGHATGTGPPALGPGPQGTYHVQVQPPAGSCHFRADGGQPLPDSSCTPGLLSPAVTQATIATTICRKGGYTRGIRPPASVTDVEKRKNAASYGYSGAMSDAEYDHLVPLSLGGDPDDPRNLWLEPPSPGHKSGDGVNNPKDAVETTLHTAVCDGKVRLADAQQAIASDWVTAESRLGLAAGAVAAGSADTN
ncbi:hypothetical protein ABIA33_001862 [Streptacidiphilus sp. MAP12-16]|uniref:hypothetical protein n=1 Tax=Streptacidiphilus sp. MAP12-16 TaxID=3156300 RepID=UPI003510E5CE